MSADRVRECNMDHDILHVGYVIDPSVQGTISLSSGRPIGKKDILFALETALKVSNFALVRDAGGYPAQGPHDLAAGRG